MDVSPGHPPAAQGAGCLLKEEKGLSSLPREAGMSSHTCQPASNRAIFFEVMNFSLQTPPSLHEQNRTFKLPVLVSSITLHQTASLTGSVSTALCLVTQCTTLLSSPPCPPSS